MAPAGRYLVIAAALFGFCAAPARAQESWEQKAWDYLFGPKTPESAQSLSAADMTHGLRVVLHYSIEYAGVKLGHYDGFNKDSTAHIPLPRNFQKARNVLEHFGLSGRLDDLELEMNRAAENATPDLLPILHQAVNEMTIADPAKIAAGPDDAATSLLRATSDEKLRDAIRPIIEKNLKEAGADKSLAILQHGLHALPMAPDLNFDAPAYVSEKTLDAIYQYMARKEVKIRARPGSTRDPLIKRLFPSR